MLPESQRKTRPSVPPKGRLWVMPESLKRELASDEVLGDLHVNGCGRFDQALGHDVKRPRGLSDTVLLHVPAGRGWVEAGLRVEIHPGMLILLPSGVPHSYAADETAPWTIEWVHFQGRAAAAFERLLGAGHSLRVWRGSDAVNGIEAFPAIYDLMRGGYTPANLLRASLLLRVLLVELHSWTADAETGDSESRVRRSMEWMRHHPSERTSLDKLARKAGLSVPHYCAIFRRLAGYPPKEHHRRLNIQRACELLDTTTLPVATVAARLGWEDPLYFSRSFRRITGVSPRAWRQMPKA